MEELRLLEPQHIDRYTHKVAISHHRIVNVTDDCITFKYKDYKSGGVSKSMTLLIQEFLRRWEQHILPKRFVKIRHYGYLQNKGKSVRIKKIKAQFGISNKPIVKIPLPIRMLEKYQYDILQCKKCKSGKYLLMEVVHKYDYKSSGDCSGLRKM